MKKKLCSLAVVSLAAAPAGQAPVRPRLIGISHVALYVSHVDHASRFYQLFLGFAGDMPMIDPTIANGPAVWIRISDCQSIDLVRERESGSDRLAEIAVATENAEGMRVYLKSRGIPVPDAVGRNRVGYAAFSVTDPDGHVVEFEQREPMVRPDRCKTKFGDGISDDMRHAGILVGALEPALKFYRDVLAFKEIWRGSRDEKELNWVNLQVPDGDDYIEFMLYRDLPEPSRRGTQHHVCLFVQNLDRALATLQARAVRAGYTRPMDIRTGTNRKRQLNLYDPDGTRIELMEPFTIDGKPAPSSTAPPPRLRLP